MFKIQALVAVLLFFAACRSLNYDDLNPQVAPNDNLLPVMEIKTDAKVYPQVKRKGKKQYNDLRSADVENIFTKEVQENIMAQEGEQRGVISLRLTYEDTQSSKLCKTFDVASAFLPYVPLLSGIPYGAQTQVLEVEVQIEDNHKRLLKRYTERVENTQYSAAWWGYNHNDTVRKVAAQNLKDALVIIRHKINQDAPQIKAELLK